MAKALLLIEHSLSAGSVGDRRAAAFSSAPSWYQVGTKWYQVGIKWYQVGTKRYQAATKWVPSGYQVRS